MSRLRVFKPAKVKPVKKWRDTLTIESLADDGRGIARRHGKVVFIDDALPGETVIAEMRTAGKRFDEARSVGREVTSSDRADPPCTYYQVCGGCQLQHLSERAQIRWKNERFGAMLSRLDGPQPMTPFTADSLHYRHRLRLFFDRGKLGLRAHGSHSIVAVPNCLIARTGLSAALKKVYAHSDWLQYAHAGELHLVEGAGDRVAAVLMLRKKPTQAALDNLRGSFPITLAQVIGEGNVLFESPVQLIYPDGELSFEPGDFTQVNPAINRQLVTQVVDWLQLESGDQVVDAFAGLGNFSLPIARAGVQVVGLEVDDAMVGRARMQAAEHGLDNLTYLSRDLFQANALAGINVNKALLDPPRAGARELCEALAASAVTRVVYVSCDPATLERDLAILIAGGFGISAARWADMFPQTSHMESLVLLTR